MPISPERWWTGFAERCYDRFFGFCEPHPGLEPVGFGVVRGDSQTLKQPVESGRTQQNSDRMRSDSVVFGLAGMFFGVLVGWIIGSQRATARRAAATAAAASPPAPPARRAPAFDEARAAALKADAERNPTDAETRVQLGNLYFDAERYDERRSWYEQALQRRSKNVNASTDLGHRLLLHRISPIARWRSSIVAGHRSEALQDTAEHRHRPGVRQAGSRGRREGVAAGDRNRARHAGSGRGAARRSRSCARRTARGARPRRPNLPDRGDSWRG